MAADASDAGQQLLALGASELRDRLASGALDAVTLVESCLARIAARDPEVHAWAHVDPDFARHQARAMDAHRRSGARSGRCTVCRWG